MTPIDSLECDLFVVTGDIEFVVKICDLYRDAVQRCARGCAAVLGVDPEVVAAQVERALVP